MEVKHLVMPHQEMVEQARERAEEIIANVGVDLDPMKEQENEECEVDGIVDHPELNICDPLGFVDEGQNLSVNESIYRKI